MTSDHGEGLGDHGEAEHGFFLYETTVRVPLIMPGCPARCRPVCASRRDARSIDILPTVLELAGAPAAVPPGIPGRSLIARRWNQVSTVIDRRQSRCERGTGYAETLFPRLHFDCSDLRSMTVDGWKYIEAPRPELYDLRTDPGERVEPLRVAKVSAPARCAPGSSTRWAAASRRRSSASRVAET